MDKLLAAHQLALLANILAVQNQILQVMISEPPLSGAQIETAQRIMVAAASTLENTGSFLQRFGESEVGPA